MEVGQAAFMGGMNAAKASVENANQNPLAFTKYLYAFGFALQF